MKTALICWLGMTDIRCSLGTEPGLGPIGQAAKERSYDSVELISNSSKQEGAIYFAWLRERTKSQINLHQVKQIKLFCDISLAENSRQKNLQGDHWKC